MTATPANTQKPLIANQLVRGHLLAMAERLGASEDERTLHVVEALQIVLGAREGVEL